MKHGALGGKLCGAGGGGFVLMLIPKEKQPAVIQQVGKKYKFLPLKFDRYGSHVVYGH